MLVDCNLVPDGPNHQLDPYFIKLIVQSPTGSLGKECKSFMTANPVPWSIHTEGKTSPCHQPIQKVVVLILYSIVKYGLQEHTAYYCI